MRNRTPRAVTPALSAATVDATDIATEGAGAPLVISAQQPGQIAQILGDDGNDVANRDDEIEGRVLVAFEDYLPNELDSWSVDVAETLENGGFIDCHPAAVAYVKSLAD